MKRVWKFVVAASMITGCAAEPETTVTEQAAGTSVFQKTWSGREASVGGSIGGGWGFLSAFENGTGATRTAFLNFAFTGPDPDSLECVEWNDPWWGSYTWCDYTRFVDIHGWGQIPQADLSFGPNAKSARLNTVTGADFFVERCTWSRYDWVYTCSAGDSLAFDLAWKADGIGSTFRNGIMQDQWGAYSFKSQGSFRAATAQVTGTAGPFTVSAWTSPPPPMDPNNPMPPGPVPGPPAAGQISQSQGTGVTRTASYVGVQP